MSIRFTSVEIIELPFVAGANHPSQRFQVDGDSDNEGEPTPIGASAQRLEDDEELDSAALTLDWQAQSRRSIDLDVFEAEKETKRKKGKLKRLTRAVKKRLLWKSSVDTSDIESEDERVSKKKKKRKKTKKIRIPGKKMVLNRFRSQDRFSSGTNGEEQVHEEKPSTRRISDDCLPQMPQRCLVSPAPTMRKKAVVLEQTNSSWPVDQQEPVEPQSPEARAIGPADVPEAVVSPASPKVRRRRTMQHTITDAMVSLAKQPAKLAKQPVKLAKSTRKRCNKRSENVTADEADELPTTRGLPALPLVYTPGESSDDEVDLCRDAQVDSVWEHQHQDEPLHRSSSSATNSRKPRRRTSMEHVSHAISVLTKQPVRLVKQPVKLAKSTRKHLKKRSKERKERRREAKRRFSNDHSCSSDESLDCLSPNSHRMLYSRDDLVIRPPPDEGHDPKAAQEEDDDEVGGIGPIPFTTEDDPKLDGVTRSFGEADIVESNTAGLVEAKKKSRRRGSLDYMANAIGVLAYQPVRLAKQPVKLAKSTRKRIKKRRKKKKQKKKPLDLPGGEYKHEESTKKANEKEGVRDTSTPPQLDYHQTAEEDGDDHFDLLSDDDVELIDESPLGEDTLDAILNEVSESESDEQDLLQVVDRHQEGTNKDDDPTLHTLQTASYSSLEDFTPTVSSRKRSSTLSSRPSGARVSWSGLVEELDCRMLEEDERAFCSTSRAGGVAPSA